MIKSIFHGVLAAIGAFVFSLLPSFMQQYLAGLATCHNELARLVGDANARPGVMTAQFLSETAARADWCAGATMAIGNADGFARLFAFLRHFDPEIARTTLRVFQPGVQLTLDGLYFFLAGVFLALVLSNVITGTCRAILGRRRHGSYR
jgi:hypothetical protein